MGSYTQASPIQWQHIADVSVRAQIRDSDRLFQFRTSRPGIPCQDTAPPTALERILHEVNGADVSYTYRLFVCRVESGRTSAPRCPHRAHTMRGQSDPIGNSSGKGRIRDQKRFFVMANTAS
jgi:hypothetical protein